MNQPPYRGPGPNPGPAPYRGPAPYSGPNPNPGPNPSAQTPKASSPDPRRYPVPERFLCGAEAEAAKDQAKILLATTIWTLAQIPDQDKGKESCEGSRKELLDFGRWHFNNYPYTFDECVKAAEESENKRSLFAAEDGWAGTTVVPTPEASKQMPDSADVDGMFKACRFVARANARLHFLQGSSKHELKALGRRTWKEYESEFGTAKAFLERWLHNDSRLFVSQGSSNANPWALTQRERDVGMLECSRLLATACWALETGMAKDHDELNFLKDCAKNLRSRGEAMFGNRFSRDEADVRKWDKYRSRYHPEEGFFSASAMPEFKPTMLVRSVQDGHLPLPLACHFVARVEARQIMMGYNVGELHKLGEQCFGTGYYDADIAPPLSVMQCKAADSKK